MEATPPQSSSRGYVRTRPTQPRGSVAGESQNGSSSSESGFAVFARETKEMLKYIMHRVDRMYQVQSEVGERVTKLDARIDSVLVDVRAIADAVSYSDDEGSDDDEEESDSIEPVVAPSVVREEEKQVEAWKETVPVAAPAQPPQQQALLTTDTLQSRREKQIARKPRARSLFYDSASDSE